MAAEYRDWYRVQSPGGYALRTRRRRVLDLLDGGAGNVLDVGCGPGVLTQELLDRGWEFWGVDASPRMIEQCLEQFRGTPRTHFTVADATALPYQAVQFEAVVCLGVIDRIPGYEFAIQEMVRVLQPGGILLVSFPNLFSPYALWRTRLFYPTVANLRSLRDRLRRRPRAASLLGEFVKLHSARGAVSLVERYGMIVSAVDFYYFNLLFSPLDELFPKLALATAERLDGLSRSRLRWLGAGFLVHARKPDERTGG